MISNLKGIVLPFLLLNFSSKYRELKVASYDLTSNKGFQDLIKFFFCRFLENMPIFFEHLVTYICHVCLRLRC